MIQRRKLIAVATSSAALGIAGLPSRSQERHTMTEPGFRLPLHATDCHSHIFDPARFPYASGRRYTPPPATVDALLRMHDRFGFQREVLVQPSVYGTDNSCMLDALRRLGPRAVGVAVIDRNFGRSRLEDLAASGVRGVRINLEVSKNADPGIALELLLKTAEQISDTGLMILMYARLPVIVACAATVRSLKQAVLIDHFGLAAAAAGAGQPGFDELLALLTSPNVYMKLSGPYQISDLGPTYEDIEPIARAMLAASPERCVWGSDWPHTGGSNRPADYKPTDIEPFRQEDDGFNIGLIKSWALDDSQRQKLMVANPARLFGFDG
jgi:2-pyrone-4,6-dicarboxylate lactonase